MQIHVPEANKKIFGEWRKGDFFFALFIIVLSIQVPISSGTIFGYSCVEIYILILAALFLGRICSEKLKPMWAILRADPIAWVLFAWSLWSVVVWWTESNWAYGINETRWVFLSFVAYLIFRIIFSQGWKQKIVILILVSIAIAILPDAQGIMYFFHTPFSGFSLIGFFMPMAGGILQKSAVGFFAHPNAFGGFVYWPMLLSLGLLGNRKTRIGGAIAFLFLGFSLFLSGYRTLILGAAIAVVLYVLLTINLSPRIWMFLLLGVTILSVLGFGISYWVFQPSHVFDTFTGRILLWGKVATIVTFSPQTILFGAGLNLPAGIYDALAMTDPHNAYLYTLVHYGVPGLILFITIVGIVLHQGWRSYRSGIFQQHMMAGALWIAFVVWFLASITDSKLTTPEWQFQFVFLLALFMAIPSTYREESVLTENKNPID